MKYANSFVKFLALTLVLMLISAIFMPDHYTLTSSVKTPISRQEVYSHLSDFQFWKNWSPLFRADSTAVIEESDKGFFWKGERIGKGSMTVKRQKKDESLEILVEFVEPREVTTADTWTLKTTEDSTEVTWQSTGELSYPMGRIFGLFLENQLQEQFDNALNSFVTHLDSTVALFPKPQVDSLNTPAKDSSLTQ